MPDEVILRRWTGKVATEREAEYAKYVADTGIEEIETSEGNLGHQITLHVQAIQGSGTGASASVLR